jgi:hypothetical protein
LPCILVRSGVVLRLLFHPKQLLLVSGGDDGEVRVWDLVDKACVAQLKVRIHPEDMLQAVARVVATAAGNLQAAMLEGCNATGSCVEPYLCPCHVSCLAPPPSLTSPPLPAGPLLLGHLPGSVP